LTIASPNVGIDRNILYAVSGGITNDVWAVGYYSLTGNDSYTLGLHWNGSQWSVTSTPNPGGSGSMLYDVITLALNNTWAVGASCCSVISALTVHWDGNTWTVVDNPAPNQ